jgi:hypothetical protein
MATDGTKSEIIRCRAPAALRAKIEEAGRRNGWGTSEEMRRRLDASFAGGPGLDGSCFGDVLATIGQAASAAAATTEGFDAYSAFETSVLLLLELFRPEGSGQPVAWTGAGIAGAALMAVGDTAKLGPLMEIVKRRLPETKP